MIKEQIEKIKALVVKKEAKDNKKTIENLVVFVIILIITIIAINTIWKKDNKSQSNKNTNSLGKQLAMVNETPNSNKTSDDNIEERLKNILSKIQGVGNVDVLVTYSKTSEVVPLYNEDLQESTTEETDKEGGTRKINENSSKKDIIYQETGGEKTPITQSIVSPKIEGAVITAQGASNIEVKSNIILAVEAVTGLGSHKIQVFEMQ